VCSSDLRYLEIYREEKILDYVSNVAGPHLLNGLFEIQKEFPDMVRNTRGKGLMCAFDLVTHDLRDKVLHACWDEKMLILPCSTQSIRFRPALNVPTGDLDKGLEIVRKALKKAKGCCCC
jgi:L-lysine 6-transaminase